jgi:hypothetical protein
MTGTIGGATYVLQFNNQQVVQGMQQTQAQIVQAQAQIVGALGQITGALNQMGNAATQATGQNTQGGGGILGMSWGFLQFSLQLRLAHEVVNLLVDSLKFMRDGMIDFNDQLAKSHLVWEVFLKDSKAADQQVQALFEYSRKTQFTFEDVDAAARQLAAFGGAAFASKENLELLGNVAAGTNKTLQTITYEFGQMYQEIENGQPFGRAARALVQFGALSAETRTKLEEMAKSGADTDEMIKVFTDDLERFNGLTQKAATETLSGSMTTLKDTVQSLIAISTKPWFDELLSGVNAVNKGLDTSTAVEVANTIKKVVQDTVDIMIVLVGSFKVAFEGIVGIIELGLIGIVEGVIQVAKALEQLPGGERFKALEDTLRGYQNNIRRNLSDLASDMDKTAKDMVDAANRALDPNWTAAGEKAADSFGGGFKAKMAAPDADLVIDAQAYIAAITAGFKGMTAQQIGVFDNATDFVKTILLGTTKGDPDAIMQEIRPMILNAIKGLHDDVNMGLVELQRVLPPEAYAQVERYIEALRAAENATEGVRVATVALNTAQQNYDDTMAAGKQAREEANAALQAAQDQMTKDMAVYDESIRGLSAALASLRQEAQDAAQEQARYVQQAQRELRALQEQIRRQEQEDKDRIEEAQKKVDDRQRIMTEHEEAFAAILDGETARFLRQHEAIDATTQAIIDRYNAEVEGKIRAQAGDDERVTRLQREERAKLLELDTRIRQERAAGHFAEAERLEKQRDRVKAGYDDQIRYASEIAAVAKDKADEAKERVQKAAEAQGETDKKEVDAATKELNGIKDAAEARRKANAEALEQAQARVQAAQDEANRVAQDYKDREQAIQQNIISVNAQKEAARIRDQAAIDDAKRIKAEVDKTWDKAEADAKATRDHAKDTLTTAQQIKTNADNSLSSLQAITAEWEKQYKYALGILNAGREARGLDPVTVIGGPATGGGNLPNDPTQPGAGRGAPPAQPSTQPPSPPPPPPAAPPPTNTNPSVPPSRQNPHFIAPDAPGFSPTDERPYPDGTWWDPANGFIPDGYELRAGDYIYWVGVPASTGAPPSPSGRPGENYLMMSSILANNQPRPDAPVQRPGGMFGVAASGGEGVAGYGIKELHVPLSFPNLTVDSPQRVAEITHHTVAGIRQALQDAHSRGVSSRIGRQVNNS